METAPGDEDVGVDGVDSVGGGGEVAHERDPVVADGGRRSGGVDSATQLVAERHGHDVGVFLRPVGDVLQAAMPVLDGEVVVVEPRVSIRVVAAPLRLAHMHVRVDVDSPVERRLGDAVPYLEAAGVLGPALVLRDHLLRDLCAVLVAQTGDHGDFERDVAAVALVDLVHHLNGVRQADEVEPDALHQVEDVLDRAPLYTFGHHRLAGARPIDTRPLHCFAARVDDVAIFRGEGSIRPTAIGDGLPRENAI